MGFKDCLQTPFTSAIATDMLTNYIDDLVKEYQIQNDIYSENDQEEDQKNATGSFAELCLR